MQGFPAAAVIDGGPARHRPAVIELPDHCSHTAATVPPEMFHAIADRLRLKKLGSVKHGVKAAGIQERLLHIIHDLSICRLVSLMLLHHIGENIPVFRLRKSLAGLQRWKRLEAKFGKITEMELPVFRDGFVPMPDIPVMNISPVLSIGIIKGSAGGRACRPVEGVRVVDFQYLRDDILIHFHIVALLFRMSHPLSLADKLFHLVVSAPQPQGGMVADPFDIVDKFLCDILFKFRGQIIDRTGKHKIFPHDQSQFITGIPESIVRIISAAPYTDTVEMSIPRLFQQFIGTFLCDTAKQVILRNIIAAHGENTDAIDFMGKLLAPRIFFQMHGHRPQPDTSFPGIQQPDLFPCRFP